MSLLFIVAAVVGLLLLLLWPLFLRWRQDPRRTDQPTTDRHPIPPAHPTDAEPGSAPRRARQGKP